MGKRLPDAWVNKYRWIGTVIAVLAALIAWLIGSSR